MVRALIQCSNYAKFWVNNNQQEYDAIVVENPILLKKRVPLKVGIWNQTYAWVLLY